MVVGDLAKFQAAAEGHARMMKKLVGEARELRVFWDKMALPGAETAEAPLVNADLVNYATFCGVLQDLLDNVIVSAGDRRGVLERIASSPITMQTKIG